MKAIHLTLPLLLGGALSAAEPLRATIDAKAKRQVIEGFGTCLISWGKTSRDPDYYNDEMARIYVEELGMNMLRVNVAPWGLPRIEEAAEIGADDIDLGHKDNSRVGVFLEFGKRLKALDPELRVIGTVWSPPAWMKVNGEITGGRRDTEPSIQGNDYTKKDRESRNRMKREFYPHFCHMLAAMCELHEREGLPFYALSPGNEVMFSQSFESCVWTAEDFATITAMLGETLEARGFGEVLLFGPETMTQHNWSIANPLYIKELKRNETAWKQLDRFATHGYVDGFEADMGEESSLEYWQLIKDYGKGYWMTEGGTGGHEWPQPLNQVAAAVHNSLVAGNANAFVPWQVASGEPNGHALMPRSRMTKKTHAFRHFSRFIPADAVRLHVPEAVEPLRVSAYHHEQDGTLSVVIINPGKAARTLELELAGFEVTRLNHYRTAANEDVASLGELPLDGGGLELEIPGESIATLSTIGLGG